ncbi:hypothetical protein NCAS_0A05720 [Naumovozyma castellii]|uniref:Major facilitator superfamily (MFS) profile domain-containing protein n=1 Tax=Naumovozyma castellii TaxID=27288 RepID=G0V6N4_NAUCA|nr:hypothetical protein NCAS_0A05720 [Naumovozyma castellii CBS 4309]CCC67130.1 hypothetical protein NCAS_0A05720 [Naumovozyma castellii CBS 4309]
MVAASSSTSTTDRTLKIQDTGNTDHYLPSNSTASSLHSQRTKEQCSNLQPAQAQDQLESMNPPPGPSRLRECMFIVIIASSQFISLAAASQAILQMDAITAWFQLPADRSLEAGWANAAFAITCGTFIIPAGKLCDLIGSKTVFIFGYAWYTLWSLLVGISRYAPKGQATFFFFGRGCQGIGAAALFPSSLALLGKYYPPSCKKNIVFSLYGFCVPLGVVVGGVFSAIFTQLAHWSWNYWSMAIVSAFFTLISCFYIPPDEIIKSEEQKKKRAWFHLPKFDYLGTFLYVASLLLFAVCWNQATGFKFKSVQVYVTLIVSLVCFVAMVIVEFYVDDPIIPARKIHPQTIKALLVVFFSYLSFTIWLFYLWKYFTVVRNDTVLLGAAKFVPLSIAGFIAALFSILLISTAVPVQIRLLAGACSFLLAHILFITLSRTESYWARPFLTIIIISIGLDISFPSATLLLSNGVPQELRGISAALVGTALNYGTGIGPPIAQTIIGYQCDKCMASGDMDQFVKAIHIAAAVGIGASGIAVVVGLYGTVTEYSWETHSYSKRCVEPYDDE